MVDTDGQKPLFEEMLGLVRSDGLLGKCHVTTAVDHESFVKSQLLSAILIHESSLPMGILPVVAEVSGKYTSASISVSSTIL